MTEHRSGEPLKARLCVRMRRLPPDLETITLEPIDVAVECYLDCLSPALHLSALRIAPFSYKHCETSGLDSRLVCWQRLIFPHRISANFGAPAAQSVLVDKHLRTGWCHLEAEPRQSRVHRSLSLLPGWVNSSTYNNHRSMKWSEHLREGTEDRRGKYLWGVLNFAARPF
jgi:hypothetical protein